MNRNDEGHQRRRLAAEEAAEWVARLEEGALSANDRAALAQWLRESPVNVAEMLRIARVDSALQAFTQWRGEAPAGLAVQDNVIALRAGQGSAAWREPPRPRPRTGRRVAALAAGIAALALAGAWMAQREEATTLHAGAAQYREFTLEDGSRVRLSPATDLSVDIARTRRSLVLHRGEAEFHVAKDAARPFVVQAALARVEAIGTVFTVSRAASAVTVSVTEGQVHVLPMVEPGESGDAMPLALGSNERVRLSVGGEVTEIEQRGGAVTSLPARSLELVFEQATVREVVERFNRRNAVQVIITDEALAQRRVTGFFDSDDPDSFVDFLALVAGARVTRSDSGQILVSGAPAPSR